MKKEIERTECIIYSRVVGWLTPTNAFNKGMEASYKNRKEFKIKE